MWKVSYFPVFGAIFQAESYVELLFQLVPELTDTIGYLSQTISLAASGIYPTRIFPRECFHVNYKKEKKKKKMEE